MTQWSRGDLLADTTAGDGLLLTRGEQEFILDVDELRWLVIAAGPAAICEIAAKAAPGAGGGPAPGAQDATDGADTGEQLALGEHVPPPPPAPPQRLEEDADRA